MRFSVIILALLAVHFSYGQELSGKVVDSKSGEPIPSAKVLVSGFHLGTFTDKEGNFIFKGSLPDSIELTISAAMYNTMVLKTGKLTNLLIQLEQGHLDLQDVVVSTPSGGLQKDNTFRLERVSMKDLNSIPASNLGEAIANINGVQSTSFGSGISKPVIRGMQGLRVLTLVNGVRMENQQWGGDHGMAVSQLGVDAVEVIKGPSSLLYGPDAFGGVVYLVDAPYSGQNSLSFELDSKGESATMGYTNSALLKVSKGNFRLNAVGLHTSHADYRLPDGSFAKNSRYTQIGGKLTLAYNHKNWVSNLRYTYSNGRFGLPGHSHDSIPDPADFRTDEQIRSKTIPAQLNQNHVISLENKVYLKGNELAMILSHTQNSLLEYEEKHTIPGTGMKLSNSMYTLRYRHQFGKTWMAVAGVQGMFQSNRQLAEASETLLPDFNQLDNGVFGILYYSPSKWKFQLGLRYDDRRLDLMDTTFTPVYSALNFAIGSIWSGSKHSWRMNISSGYRSPHVSELLSNGIHHGAQRYELGNPALKSEQAIQFDLGYELHLEHLELIINPFYSYVMNYISLNQVDSLIDQLPVFAYQSADKAHLYGLDLGLHYHPHFAHWLHVESSYSLVEGEEINGQAFSLMPQSRINSFIKIRPTQKTSFGIHQIILQYLYYFKQDRVGIAESPSKDYHLIHAGIDFKWNLKTPILISLGVKNVLNQSYINHLSNLKNLPLEHMGRNVYVAINYSLTKIKKDDKN